MEKEVVFKTIVKALRDRFGAGLDIKPETKFDDIAESLEIFEFIFAIEDHFDINLPEGILTVGELVDFIGSKDEMSPLQS